MRFSYPALESLVAAIAQALPANATVLDIGFPGGPFSRLLGKVAPALNIMEAISPRVLASHPEFTRGLSTAPDVMAVAQKGHSILRRKIQRLGQTDIHVAENIVAMRCLHDFIQEFKTLALLHINLAGADTDMLLSALAPLAKEGTIVWCDITDVTDSPVETVLENVAQDDFDVFIVSRQNLVVLPVDRIPGDEIALVLLPRSRWSGFGLRELATRQEGRHDTTVPARLITPVTLGASQSVIARLARSKPQTLPPFPEKIFLPIGRQSFVSEAVVDSDTKMLAVLKPCAKIRFFPPTSCTFIVSVVVAQSLDRMAAKSLRICIEGREATFKWIAEWYQIEIAMPVTVRDPRQPVTITIERVDEQKYSGYAMLITGIQLKLIEQSGIGLTTGSARRVSGNRSVVHD